MAPPSAPVASPLFYPVEDHVGETLLHLEIRTLLRTLVQAWLAENGERALLTSDQFVYWVEGDPSKTLGPDLLLLPGEDPRREVTSLKLWEEDHQPRFAVEVVSDEIDKDYVQGPPLYDELGVEELVIYDPLVPHRGRTRRVRWQVYRRTDGAFAKVLQTNADRVESRVLGCWLVEVPFDGSKRVRLARGEGGSELVPTPEEALRAEIERLRTALRTAR